MTFTEDEITKLRTVFADDEIAMMDREPMQFQIDQVVLKRWYRGGAQPGVTGVGNVDDGVASALGQINILPAGQPDGAPRWPGIHYGDVVWGVNGTSIAMGDCPPPKDKP